MPLNILRYFLVFNVAWEKRVDPGKVDHACVMFNCRAGCAAIAMVVFVILIENLWLNGL